MQGNACKAQSPDRFNHNTSLCHWRGLIKSPLWSTQRTLIVYASFFSEWLKLYDTRRISGQALNVHFLHKKKSFFYFTKMSWKANSTFFKGVPVYKLKILPVWVFDWLEEIFIKSPQQQPIPRNDTFYRVLKLAKMFKRVIKIVLKSIVLTYVVVTRASHMSQSRHSTHEERLSFFSLSVDSHSFMSLDIGRLNVQDNVQRSPPAVGHVCQRALSCSPLTR